ncbi:MAG: efflux RND transporter permease subunit [Gemmatimonadales bacterium]
MSLPRLSIQRPVAVAMLFLAIGFVGAISYIRLPIDLLPDVAYPRLIIYTTYTDVGPSEVERFVSAEIERAVAAVPGVEQVESTSREGVSLVSLRFAWGTDMDFAALNVRERLDNIRDRLPELASRPVVLRTDPNAEPIMAISVAGRNDLRALRDLAEEVFKRRLEQMDGIAQAATLGGLEREIQVEVNPRLLESYGITIDQVGTALAAANQSAPGGTVQRGRFRYSLRTLGEFQTVNEIADVTIRRPDGTGAGRAVRLADIAVITDGFEERESIVRYDGTEAVGLLLFKESGANTVRVTQEVERVLDQLRRQYPDLRVEIAMAQAGFISDAISNVVQALLFGGVLAFLVLFLFLRDVRYPVAVALAIPISVVAVFPLLDLGSVSLNVMSLGGLALGVGMLVDNSIVVLENIFRHKELGASPEEAAARGAEEVQGAIAASTLTTISVFGPIIYVQGVAGQLFRPLSLAVAFALLASLVVALTLLPALAARWKGAEMVQLPRMFRGVLDAFDRRFRVFADWYHRRLEEALEHKGRVALGALALLVGGLGLGWTLERSVLPDVDQGAFEARLTLPRGTPIEETERVAGRLEHVFLADPDVEAVFSRIGREAAVAGVEETESGLNTAKLEVRLHEGASTRRALERMAPQLAPYPPDVIAIETGRATALGRLLGGGEADLAVRVRGDDLDAAIRYALDLERRLVAHPALTNVRLETGPGQPEIRVAIDRERAASYGIEPRLVAQTVERYMRGSVATQFVDFDRRIPVMVRLPDVSRRSIETLRELRVNGIALSELVTLHEELGPAEIRRVDQGRTATLLADAGRGGLDGALAAVQEALRDSPPPRGLRADVGGENEERREGYRALAFAFGLAVLLVYMILAAQFESLIHPFTILLAVPLSTFGAAFALWIVGGGLNTMSLIGFVILVGIVVNDAIVKVDFINLMRGQGMNVRTAVLEAGRARLRPILMTTVTTVLGLLPMALGLGRGADLRAPLAVAVIGGLISATALTLIVVPVAYEMIENLKQKFTSAFATSAA